MIYVALLRGINVGGNNKVSMAELKLVFEQAGMGDVKTYINSGNVIFTDTSHAHSKLAAILEQAIRQAFTLEIHVLVRSIDEMKLVAEAIPDNWGNNEAMKCDVMFLWDGIDHEDTLKQLVIKPGIDTVRYLPGTILFAVDRQNATKSGVLRLIGTPLYKKMTIRNCNTARKLYAIMSAVKS